MEEFFVATMIVLIFATVFGFLAFLRFMRYREVAMLAEKGLLTEYEAQRNGKGALRWGVLLAALGLALTIGLYPIGFIDGVAELGFLLHLGPWMLVGLIPLFFGLGLVLIHLLTQERRAGGHETSRGATPRPALEGDLDTMSDLTAGPPAEADVERGVSS